MPLHENYNLLCYSEDKIANGYSNILVYREQRIAASYIVDASGNITSQPGGTLHQGPLLLFNPTNTGPVAMVTEPDIATGLRGTGIVHVAALQLDANHDGTMDLRFGGEDDVTSSRPFEFWVNDDYDRLHTVDITDQEEDDLESSDPATECPGSFRVSRPDHDYANYLGYGQWAPAIASRRDLEDYARLWIPGLSSAVAAMPANCTVRLSVVGDGAIRLFRAVESGGGTGYLFDETVASNQVAQSHSLYLGRLSSDTPIVLTGKTNLGERFIWCGAKRGFCSIKLEVLDADQTVVSTISTYIDLKDIKEMYERWTVGDDPSKEPESYAHMARDGLPQGAIPFRYPAGFQAQITNSPYILHVHGWNLKAWEKDRYAETAFKRLYWQAYQGRFGSFRWPTTQQTLNPLAYDKGEFQAWKSATGLLNLLRWLNSKCPGHLYLTAHSMGNVVAGEALRLAGTNQIVNTYVAMQGAVPSHAYDPTTPQRTIFPDSNTPDRHAEYWTNGAPCYFSSAIGAETYVNFYNTNDWALTLLWRPNQDLKPDIAYSWVSVPGEPERYYYTDAWGNPHGKYFPADTYEIFSYITEARCQALGAQANVAGAFFSNGQHNQFDVDGPPLSFSSPHKGHSGQFRSTNMKRQFFWERLLLVTGLSQTQ